jgi:hypothetical protein
MPRTYTPKQRKLPEKFKPGFMSTLDHRSPIAKALRERFACIATDLGGINELSHIKASLLERFVFLEATISRLEAELATTNDAASASLILSRLIQASNSHLGLAKTLGLERFKKPIDLKAYVAAQKSAEPVEAGS